MISSIRFRNSGRKWSRSWSVTRSAAAAKASAPASAASMSAAEPMLLVMITTVLRKSTVRPWRVGQAAVVEELEQDVEDVGVGLLDLVEEHHLVRPAADRLGQLAAFFVADVAGRRTDQPRHRELLHVLAHVDAHHRALVVEQEFGQRAGELGLADAGRPQEDERADRPLRILEAAGATDGVRRRRSPPRPGR